MSFGGIKITPADSWFSKCVRERAGWCCELCGTYYPEGVNRAGLHCSHYIGRRNTSTRWEPMNCASLCLACHRRVEEDPLFHTEFITERIGVQAFEILMERKRAIVPKRDRNIKEIAAHYRVEFRRMAALRAAGETGRLEFVGW